MVVCLYCKNQYKRITSRHLEKHNIKYLDYLEKYERDRYYEKIISVFFWEFYRPYPYKFIEQVYSKEDKKFVWVTKFSMSKKEYERQVENVHRESNQSRVSNVLINKRKYPLSKNDFVQHLPKERTIGIFSHPNDTTFLTFNIDEDNMNYVQCLYYTLRKYGIEEEQILMSTIVLVA